MPIKLLIVDDSEQMLTSLRGLLEDAPDVVGLQQAPALALALVNLGRKPPGLVVLDLELPHCLDQLVMTTLKQRLPGLRVATLSNDASAFVRAACAQAGADWLFERVGAHDNPLDLTHPQICLS